MSPPTELRVPHLVPPSLTLADAAPLVRSRPLRPRALTALHARVALGDHSLSHPTLPHSPCCHVHSQSATSAVRRGAEPDEQRKLRG